MSLHKEISFETEICQSLESTGWLYSPSDDGYNRQLALYPEDITNWVKATQPNAWDALAKNHGQAAGDILSRRLRDCLNQQGTLDILRHGLDVLGLKGQLKMAQFKPALAINADILARYAANRLRVMRQVHYSTSNQNSIDLVLFLNGIPVGTLELKTDFTQSVDDAINQYRYDREPAPKGQNPEPLLSFIGGALVHFAVSNREVHMTTRLQGKSTTFLPFNKGDHGAAGNPLNPKGHATDYLWEEVLQRDSWLEILGKYMVAQRDEKKQLRQIVFPRYHQLDATRKLQAEILKDGPGQKYLIQHSAGSGKTNSIAWTAHFLADLHNASNKKLFDSVLVVSDRNVIDGQLQEAIFSFERTTGVVATIKGEGNSKSSELFEALSGDKKIIVCTIQTFPAAIKAVRELTATQGKTFAVIADEAHSSQTGEAASNLKQLLSAEEQSELADGGEISNEDILAAQMSSKVNDKSITYVAFTATPKAKTLELFGRRPDPSLPSAQGNLPEPFHVYSMRQAIEEGFILDVLQNYISYNLAFKLANNGKEYDDKEVERSKAMKGLMGWVRLHPYNISQKVMIVVEHFRTTVAPLLDGKAKAMVVVGSRVEAVRWQLAIDKYIKSKGYPLRTLVAFSGEVEDKESGPDPFKETSKSLNPFLKTSDIREAFKGDDYQILLVANKFQTGFDQPLLCGMYVDKRLDGIQAVQTLSRLNRCYPKKTTTFVLDFVNESADILKAFKTYYTTATLSDATDPNIILDLKAKLDSTGYYDDYEINRVVDVELDPNAKQSQLQAAIEPVAQRLLNKYKKASDAYKAAMEAKDDKAKDAVKDEMDALVLFKTDMTTYHRAYTFLSQVFDYGNTELEKRAIFYRHLVRLLKFGLEREEIDLSQVVLTHHNLKYQGKQKLNLSDGEAPTLEPLTNVGSGQVQTKAKAQLSDIIEKLNELFKGVNEDDKLIYVNKILCGKLLESETLIKQATNNTEQQFASSPDLIPEIINAGINALDTYSEMSTQLLNSRDTQEAVRDVLILAGLYEMLRKKSA